MDCSAPVSIDVDANGNCYVVSRMNSIYAVSHIESLRLYMRVFTSAYIQ